MAEGQRRAITPRCFRSYEVIGWLLPVFILALQYKSLVIGCVMNFAPVIAMRQMAATPLMVGNTFGAATLVGNDFGLPNSSGWVPQAAA